jgi:hypothetical protein
MVAPDKENLAKIVVRLPSDAPGESESLWAESLGNDLYRLRNSPWFAFGLHFHDVVRAVPDGPGELPRVREVVRRSGHKTLRVLFDGAVDEPDRKVMLEELHRWRCFHENADETLYALDVQPEGDNDAVFDQLTEWEEDGKLQFETAVTEFPHD